MEWGCLLELCAAVGDGVGVGLIQERICHCLLSPGLATISAADPLSSSQPVCDFHLQQRKPSILSSVGICFPLPTFQSFCKSHTLPQITPASSPLRSCPDTLGISVLHFTSARGPALVFSWKHGGACREGLEVAGDGVGMMTETGKC